MDCSFVTVIGNFVRKDTESVVKCINQTVKEETGLKYFVANEEINNQNLLASACGKDLQCVLYTPTGSTLFHEFYALKSEMDKLKISDGYVFVPTQALDSCNLVVQALFPAAYNMKLVACTMLSKNYEKTPTIEEFLSNLRAKDEVKILKSKLLPHPFNHGFSLRYGGLSTFPDQASLNMCFSPRKRDTRAVISENRNRLAKAGNFDPSKFHVAKAVHGKGVWVYEKQEPESYDGIVTNTHGVTVAAPGADCNMLLFVDPVTKSCGAAHAGWKGILAGIVEEMVRTMIKEYGTNPENLLVTNGPSLGACCCEFGVDESRKFLSIDKRCVVWKENHPKPFLDLRVAVRSILIKEGVKEANIEEDPTLKICTKCDPDHRLFSFRRDGLQFGNQLGFVAVI